MSVGFSVISCPSNLTAPHPLFTLKEITKALTMTKGTIDNHTNMYKSSKIIIFPEPKGAHKIIRRILQVTCIFYENISLTCMQLLF